VADAERVQLHELPRVVLVGPVRAVQPVVEPDELRRVLRDLEHEVVEPREGVLPLGLVLVQDERRAADLRDARGPVEVPEVRHLFLERAGRKRHPVEEPLLEAADVGEVVVLRGQALLVGGHVDRVVVHEPRDRALETPPEEVVDLGRRAAEARPPQEVRGRVPGPVDCGHGRLLGGRLSG
jgi:hypothetical protein